jgi:hypothetical protein
MKNRRVEVGPCGVFCLACPSYNKSCLGCSSESKNQKRKSKWSCKIRKCCYKEMKIDYCGYCENFPCDIINRKLIKSHVGDIRFKYRHEIPENMNRLKQLGVGEYIKRKKQEYLCPGCGGVVYFYYNKCSECGKSFTSPKNKK